MSRHSRHAGRSSPRWRLPLLLLALAGLAILFRRTADWPTAAPPAPLPGGPTTTRSIPPTAAPPSSATQLRGRVVRILDGDSFVVRIDGAEQQVRLQGVDCPEHGQPFGNKARQLTRKLALHKQITIESVGRDQYDRILGHPHLPDGRRLDYELVRAGMAWWYRHYSDDPRLGDLEAAARRDKRGLWRDASPVPPWKWRREHRR